MEQPNIVVILADDLGFSDLGCYGSEIDTPNLDALAAGGALLNNYYTTPRCCPSRASLLTGLYPHQTGIGDMTHEPASLRYDKGVPGYRGFLNRSCVTMAEALREAGYHTWMCGKWHLGYHGEEKWPCQRGFERFYGILAGACNYRKPTHPRGLYLDNTPVERTGGDFYSTDAFTDYAVQFLREQDDHKPFFLYLSYNAPHWPLQAPDGEICKYRGSYRRGWDALRRERWERMRAAGLIGGSHPLSLRDPGVRPWEALTPEQQDEMDLRMSVYAAQIDRMDQNIGRLTDALRERGKLENTLILFASDNGGCAEGGELGGGKRELINAEHLEKLMISYGAGWANVSNTPYRLYKRDVAEGGIASPLIAHYPAGIRAGLRIRDTAVVNDLMPTLLDYAGARYPDPYRGNPLSPLEGVSLRPLLEGGDPLPERFLYWEHEDDLCIRLGRWKALRRRGREAWELYDLELDQCELCDVSGEHPEKTAALSAEWIKWARSHWVVPKDLEEKEHGMVSAGLRAGD